MVAGSAVIDDVLSAEEARRLPTAARGDRLEALGAVVLGTGLRKGEAVGAPAFVVEALGRHAAQQLVEKEALGPDWAEGDLVLATIVGTPIDPRRNGQRWWDRMCKRAGIGKRRPHAARHTTATAALAAGGAANVTAALGGWGRSATAGADPGQDPPEGA